MPLPLFNKLFRRSKNQPPKDQVPKDQPPDETAPKDQSSTEETIHQFLLEIEQIQELLLDQLDYSKVGALEADQAGLRAYLTEETNKAIAKRYPQQLPDETMRQRLIAAVIDEMVGFGPLEILMQDKGVTDVFINSYNDIFIETKGKIQNTAVQFLDNDHIFRLVNRIASKSGRHLDLSSPYFDSQLPDGSRIHAIIPPLAIDGIKVSIRKYSFNKLDLFSLVGSESMDEMMAKFLQLAIRSRFNVVICGGTGSGKTTLMNALLTTIPAGERIITIEDTPELEPGHAHAVRLLTRQPNPEGKGGVGQAELMINALRMRPDRVILGELRGSEAFNLLHAMNTGQDGTMATLHASGPEEVVSRLLNMILMARYALSAESVRHQIAGALDLIIYVTRLINGARRVMNISQVSSTADGDVKIDDIFRLEIAEITATSLKAQFVKLAPSLSKRIVNKLMVAGCLKEYKELFGLDE